MPSRTETIQIPTPINGANCPSTAPNTGDACSWVDTNMFGSYQYGYLSDTSVPQLPGTFITVCKCDSTDRFVCARAVDQMYTTIDAEVVSKVKSHLFFVVIVVVINQSELETRPTFLY